MKSDRFIFASICLVVMLVPHASQAASPDARLVKMLTGKNEAVRLQAIHALQNDPQRCAESLSQLVSIAKAEADATLPDQLARPSFVELLGLIGMINRPESEQLLSGLLDSPHLGIAMVAADVLGNNKFPGSIEALKKQVNRREYSQSYGFRFNLIRSLAQMDHPDAIEFLTELQPRLDGQLRYETDKLLARVTAADFRGDLKRFEAWQQAGKSKQAGQSKVVLTSTDSESQSRERIGLAPSQQYYGIDIHSKRMMFIIDNSGSMRESDEGGSRLQKAKYQLIQAIQQLPSDAQFAILFYSTKVYQWRNELSLATDENKQAAIAFVADLGFGNQTNTYGALRLSLEFDSDLEAVFLLTDGHPTIGDIVYPQAIVADIVHRNRFRHLNFNTIGIALDPQTEMFLRTLSEASGGEFRKAN